MKYLTLFLILFIACSTEKRTNIIYIEVTPEKMTLDQTTIAKDDLEKELKSIIDNKKTQGFKREELVKVDERTRRGDLGDIEATMRRLNVKKVTYSTFSKEKTIAN